MRERSQQKKLRTLLAEVSGKDAWRVSIDDDLIYELGLDSLAALRLLAGVEKQFGIRFPDENLGDIRTLGQLTELIEKQ